MKGDFMNNQNNINETAYQENLSPDVLSAINTFGSPYTPKSPPSFIETDCIFAWLSIIVGFFFFRTLPITQNSLGGVLFTILLFAFGVFYLLRSKIRIKSSVIMFATVICIYSFGLITNSNKSIQTLIFLFILASFPYWIYTAFGLNEKNMFGDNCILHALYSTFVLPIISTIYFFPAISVSNKRNRSKKIIVGALWGLLGLAIAIIPTAIICMLLSYDQQFANIIRKVYDLPFNVVWEYIRDIFFGAIIATVLFGTLFGTKHQHKINNGKEKQLKQIKSHIMPRIMLCCAVTPILFIYVIFFISQWNYYVSAFTHILPENLTYAEYARDGFFELCLISAINAVLLLLFNLLIRNNGKAKDPIRTFYSSLIAIFTLILIATALSKMALYIGFFGLTQKRVYASWFMILLAVIFMFILLRQFVRRIKLISAIAISCIIAFGVITLPNVDAMIASYNVNAYISGDLETVDVESISEYGVSAVPALVKLRSELEANNEQGEIKIQTDIALEKIASKIDNEDSELFSFNIPTIRAKKLLE